ncbi:MAG TPA: ATP-binding protein [Methylomirabilota bacterium]|nr:ATP-binding protein [Methylomirabilota bacterium]
MPVPSAELLYRLANVVLGASALGVAALIIRAIHHRAARRAEPLGVVFALVFLGIGLCAAVRVWATPWMVPAEVAPTMIAIDWLAAGATFTFLLLRHRYAVFIETAGLVREYETEYAEKDREARALAQVNEELRRLDQLKSEFLAMVSHELRTPLTAIIGYSRLLTRQVHGPLSPKQLEHQEAIFRSAQRLSDLINDLLDVSRLEAGRVELNARPTHLRHAVDQVITVVTVAAQAKQIRIENAVPADTPLVQADPSRLQQILVNLVGNGVKFSNAGGLVRVTAGAQRDRVWVGVEDRGVGIAKEELARIWDPFYQVEAPMQRRHGGSGLGLAIVRRLVELHGGVVRAESEGENCGSRFTFTLPVAAEVPVAQTVRPAEVPALEPFLEGREVLIVEDETQTQDLMRVVVEDLLGGVARVCDDGEQGMREAVERPPALILLDLMLPRVSGWEVARRLRHGPRTAGVPIIAVSALSRSQEREAALHAGCDAYLTKPFTPDELARLVAATLHGQRVGAH